MCGIAGFFDKNKKLDDNQLWSYNKAMKKGDLMVQTFFLKKMNMGMLDYLMLDFQF